ncbi:MAG TPA: dNTP triphosphohydrolase [Saprospiraceae bacterium]|nr:dNTP triphosphohydrolase [Saprospiraceae bacterium]
MNWDNCISAQRSGKYKSSASSRSEYQRDYDRLVFSSAFRRLQNKTQVFALPGNVFVHNRLTHSLEVSSVGRSIGNLVGEHIAFSDVHNAKASVKEFYKYELPYVISAACLAHDVGNPPFGHSGEKAISYFFEKNEGSLKSYFNEREWSDLTNFEGNANALHILTTEYTGKISGGQTLTNTTLASILKYPCEAEAINKSFKHRKKYGFFQCDKNQFLDIAKATHMIKDDSVSDFTVFKRHPFVYLVEAADDICYRVIDMEDAHRIGILTTEHVVECFTNILADLDRPELKISKIKNRLTQLRDNNEKVAYLRAKLINGLVTECTDVFIQNKDLILEGKWNSTLLDEIESKSTAVQYADEVSIRLIYNHRSVIEVELAAFNVLSELLELFVFPKLKTKLNHIEEKTMSLIPPQFIPSDINASPYEHIIRIVDFIAGMTDGFATELYRKSKGIEIAAHR